MLWFIIATIGSIFSEHNMASYAGNVTKTCMGGNVSDPNSWYALACGPRGALGAESLTYRKWRALGYTAGFHERDTRIFDAFASEAIKRTEEMGEDPLKPGLLAAAKAWYQHRNEDSESSDDDDVEEEKAALFTYQMCRVMRLSDVGEYGDNGPDYHDYTGSSLSHLSARYLYESYAVLRFESTPLHILAHAHSYTHVSGANASNSRSSTSSGAGCTTLSTRSARARRTGWFAKRTSCDASAVAAASTAQTRSTTLRPSSPSPSSASLHWETASTTSRRPTAP